MEKKQLRERSPRNRIKKKKKKKEIKEEALEHRHNAASDCLSCCSISSDQSIFA